MVYNFTIYLMVETYHTLSEAYMAILADVYANPDHIRESLDPEAVKARSDNPVAHNPNFYFNKNAKQEKVNYHFIIKEPSDKESITTHSESRNKIIYEYSSKETVLFDKGDRV